MMTLGTEGYRNVSELLHKKACEMAKTIETEFQGVLKLLANPDVNIVSFQVIMGNYHFSNIAPALAQAMARRNIVIKELHGDTVQLYVTMPFALADDATDKFITALKESLEELNILM